MCRRSQIRDRMARVIEDRALGDFERDPAGRAALALEQCGDSTRQFGFIRSRAERLIDTLTGRPAARHAAHCATALPTTHSVIAQMYPVCSARGTNSDGGTRPRDGCCQRTSASTKCSPLAGQRHLRLVHERELVVVDRLAQVAHERKAREAVLIVAVVPDRDAEVAALRRVHRDVGMTQQLGRLPAVFGVRRDADAGTDVDDVALERHRRRERLQHQVGRALRVADAVSREQDRELVAAQARDDGCRAPDARLQPRRPPPAASRSPMG